MAPRAKSDYTPQELILNAVEQVVSRGGKQMMDGKVEEATRLFNLAKAVMEVVNAYDAEELES